MAGGGVPSTPEESKSHPEIELVGNRRKKDLDFLPHLPLALQLVSNSEASKLDLKVSYRGQISAFVLPKIVPLVPHVAVPRISYLAPELKSMQRRQQNEAKY
jgi:hypothetical protein